MGALVQDLRYALRAALTNPGFVAAAVLSIGIGIGANTTLFSVANALLLSPLPYADAERLAILWNRSPGLNIAEHWFSTAQYFDIKNGHGGFEDVAIAIGGKEEIHQQEIKRPGDVFQCNFKVALIRFRGRLSGAQCAERVRHGSTSSYSRQPGV
jgi:hypothetical protein